MRSCLNCVEFTRAEETRIRQSDQRVQKVSALGYVTLGEVFLKTFECGAGGLYFCRAYGGGHHGAIRKLRLCIIFPGLLGWLISYVMRKINNCKLCQESTFLEMFHCFKSSEKEN